MATNERSDMDTQTPVGRPTWRARQYGKHRSRGQELRAYLFASREGRRTLRTLWRIRGLNR